MFQSNIKMKYFLIKIIKFLIIYSFYLLHLFLILILQSIISKLQLNQNYLN